MSSTAREAVPTPLSARETTLQTKKPTKLPQRRFTPTYRTVFEISNPEKYKAEGQLLLQEIMKYKAYVHIKFARISENNRLVIGTGDEEAEAEIKSEWNPKAFGGHMKRIEVKQNYCVAIQGVRKSITNDEIEASLKGEGYTVEYMTRVRINEEVTQTVRVQLGTKDQMEKILKKGVYINYRHHLVRYWMNDVIRCYKCQRF